MPDSISPISLYDLKLLNNSNERLSYRLSATLAVLLVGIHQLHCMDDEVESDTHLVVAYQKVGEGLQKD